MQTPRDVIDSLLRKKKADRVGVMDSPWADTLRAWVVQGMPADEKGAAVDSVEHFGFDHGLKSVAAATGPRTFTDTFEAGDLRL